MRRYVAVLVLAMLIGLLVLSRGSHAAEFTCAAGDVACLIDAIRAANANGEANTLTLEAGTYTLTTPDNNTDGPNDLPSVTSPLTIRGAGGDDATVIAGSGTSTGRLMHVAASGTLTLEGLSLQGGRLFQVGGPFGGGLFNKGTLTLVQSTLAHNDASGGQGLSGRGGGLYNDGGTVAIIGSTVADNRASGATRGQGFGGGIYNAGGTVMVLNSTFTRNTADGKFLDSQGGALYNAGGAVRILNTTIVRNITRQEGSPSGAGGLFNAGGQITVQNTLLALHEAQDCSGTIASLGHNLIEDPTGCDIALQDTDLTGNPRLGPFTDDGTPGHGHVPLLAGSPAIDAGNDDACPDTDQLGQPRVDRCDIGAIEFQPPEVVVQTGNGRAEKLGTTNAKVALEGQLTGAPLTELDLGASTVRLTSILHEGGGELVAAATLPLTLAPRPGSDADGATFETPGAARPKVRLDLSRRDTGVVSFRLVVEFAPSHKPASCAGTPRTTELTTSFLLDPGPVSVITTQPWQCLAEDSQLRVPVP